MCDLERILRRNAEAVMANNRGEWGSVVANSLRDVKDLVKEIEQLRKDKTSAKSHQDK